VPNCLGTGVRVAYERVVVEGDLLLQLFFVARIRSGLQVVTVDVVVFSFGKRFCPWDFCS